MTVAAGRLTLCCADLDARPLFWTEPDGTRDGYEPDAAACVAAALGLELVWEFRRWDRFAGALADGEVDAIWCGSAITEERRKVFSYSRPYAAIDEAVLVRADSESTPRGAARTRVGAIVASTNMRLAESFGAAELVGFDGSSDDVFAEMVAAVDSGAIDAMVDDEPAFGAQLASGDFRIAHVAETQNAWGAACRLGDDADGRAARRRHRPSGLERRAGRRVAPWFGDKPVPRVIAG